MLLNRFNLQNVLINHHHNLCDRIIISPFNSNIHIRSFHVTIVSNGKRNFRKFPVPNKRGQWEHPKLPNHFLENEFDYPQWRDTLHVRWPGVWFRRKFVHVLEMEPQLIVPDLEGFNLKPYVSYRTSDIYQNKFSARDLFNATHADQIIEKFKKGEEMVIEVTDQDIEDAKLKAQQTGADLFIHNPDHGIGR